MRAIVDTTLILHLYRRYSPALDWYSTQSESFAITTISWLEVMYGAGSKAKQNTSKLILEKFDLIYLTYSDQSWAIEQMENLRLRHGITLPDCLIASVAHRLQLPLYTHNTADFEPMIGQLAIRPYV